MKNKLTPLQQLRREKRELKKLYKIDEDRLSDNWDYLTHNIGSLTFHTALKSTRDMIMGTPKKEERLVSDNALLNSLSSSLPMIWDIAQPVLIGYVVNKFKSMFSSKKKIKKGDY